MKEEFLELLRTDQAFREEVRRQLLTEELLALPERFGQLVALVREALTLLGHVVEAVQGLAAALAQLREQVGQLEERVARLEEAVTRLAEAQARTEERVGRLEEAVAQLAEAQARTERRVEELAQAQLDVQKAIYSLAQQVGRLSEVIGFTLEDLAREVTPAYLAQHYGIRVGELERRFFTVGGEEIEIDLYGEGWRDSEPVVVIGEVRSRIYGRDVEATVRRAREVQSQVTGTPVVVLFGFVIHPSAREVAHRLGAIVISSSGR